MHSTLLIFFLAAALNYNVWKSKHRNRLQKRKRILRIAKKLHGNKAFAPYVRHSALIERRLTSTKFTENELLRAVGKIIVKTKDGL